MSGVNLETERVNPALIKKKSPLKWIIIVGISVLLISGNTQDNTQDNDIIVNHAEKSKKLENEFQFNTKVNDLKRINVRQKTQEDIIIDNNKTTISLFRNTNYDIYIISEEDSDEENKNYYDKMYTAALSISSECYSKEDENCVPEKMVDLTNSEKSRNLDNTESNPETINDLKDIPLPLCLFNITNNDAIMSLTCHKSLSEFKKRMIVLDLYFFRPPAIKRLNKEENNITINEYDGKKLIRETNGGICDIENAFSSFCTTDMNITIDSQSNLLEYEEVAFMSVTSDENNSYQKNKVTKLIDETSKMTSFSPEKYKEVLTKLLPKLEPYFQTDILFTSEKFQEVYIASKEGVDKLNNKLKYRKLTNNGKEFTNENNLFNYNSNDGIEINMGLKINSGINSEYSEANSNIQIEDLKKNIATSKESSSNFNKIINELIVLSESGNHLATQLYEKTNNSLDSMTLEINERISDLNSLIKFQDFSEIFDSTLSLENLRVLPTVFIDETTNIKKIISIIK